MLGRASVKLAGAERLRRSCQPLDNPHVTQLLAEARRAVGLARKVRVVVTDKLTSPAVVGVLVPTLVLPLTLVTTLTPEQIRFILLHELAHIRRGDYLANLFQFFVEAVLFFNPAVWWISHQVRREREACCDALAIELSGSPADYARTLIHVAEKMLSPVVSTATAFGEKRGSSSLTDRVQRLLVPGYRPSLRLTWRAMIAAFMLGTFLLILLAEGTRVAVAQIAKSNTETRQSTPAPSREQLSPSNGTFELSNHFTNEFNLGEQEASGYGSRVPVKSVVSPELERVKRRLNDLRFRFVGCSNKPLGELFRELSKESETFDKDGIGLMFSVIPIRLRALPATIAPPLTNASLLEVLAAIQGVPPLRLNGVNTNGLVTLQTIASLGPSDPKNNNAFKPTAEHAARVELNIFSNQPPAQKPKSPIIKTSEKRREILNKLNLIRLERVAFDAVPLSNVVLAITAEAQRLDPEGRGVKIVINSNVNSPEDGRPVDISASKVTIDSPLTNVRLMDALNAILKCADTPLKLSIEEYAAVISLKGKEPTPLFMREFRVGPTNFAQRIAEKGFPLQNVNNTTDANQVGEQNAGAIRNVLANAGINLDPMQGKSIFYNDRLGSLLVRATMEELDRVEEFLWSFQPQATQANGGISPTNNASGLFTRTFKVDPSTFGKALENIAATPVTGTNITSAVRSFFATLGVELTPPKGVYYNDRAGELVVRSTGDDLDVIEAALVAANKPTPQVNIKVRFVEVERGKPGADWYLGTIGNLSGPNPPPSGVASSAISNSGPQSFTGILTDPQFRVVLRDLEQRKGVSLLSEGEVTTLSGRQAQIQVVELSTIVNAATFPAPPLPGNTTTNSTSTNLYQTQVIPFGPVLDVIPTVAADGYTIQMTVIPTVTEFLGYDDPKKVLASSPVKSKDAETLPLPRMRIRQVSTSAVVWDGQTLVLGIGNDQVITKQPGGGVQKAKNPDTHQKQLLVFITPTIVDPAGNRMSPSSNRTKAASDESFTTPTNLRPIIDVPLY